jgi:hypothetical protein
MKKRFVTLAAAGALLAGLFLLSVSSLKSVQACELHGIWHQDCYPTRDDRDSDSSTRTYDPHFNEKLSQEFKNLIEQFFGLFKLPPPKAGHRDIFRPHMVADGYGGWKPEDGYVMDGSGRPKWTPGRRSSRYPHIVTAEKEGKWEPEDGYAWINRIEGDFRVEWVENKRSARWPHVVSVSFGVQF